jgi:hypothetical protein
LYAIAVPDATHDHTHQAKPVNFKMPTGHKHSGTEMVFSGTILVIKFLYRTPIWRFFGMQQTPSLTEMDATLKNGHHSPTPGASCPSPGHGSAIGGRCHL